MLKKGDAANMLEWLNTHIAYWHWLVLGLLLVTAEIFVSGFVLFWFGLAALLIGVLTLAVDMPFTLQLILWAFASVAFLVIWVKSIKPRWKDRSLSGMGAEALMGQVGLVLESNAGRNRGRLKFPAHPGRGGVAVYLHRGSRHRRPGEGDRYLRQFADRHPHLIAGWHLITAYTRNSIQAQISPLSPGTNPPGADLGSFSWPKAERHGWRESLG
ncbi:NfeD family protein [Microbulbifer taiwanensis]|uniref:NfeD family protein n=1 Tax=Microbulbifer taiwanensis TaxID=986746 RepID=UPI00360B2C93